MIELNELWRLAGWTMLHYLWIGLAIGAAALLVRVALRRTSPLVRYSAQLVMFVLLAIAPLVILASLAPTHTNNNSRGATLRGAPQADVGAQTPPAAAPNAAERSSPAIVAQAQAVPPQAALKRYTLEAIAHALPWLWLAGAPLTFALLASGVLGVERLKRSAQLLTTGPVRDACDRLTQTLKVTQRTVVAISDAVAQPVLVGIVRPLILLPAALVAECSPEQLELVLAHELAHVRRRDNLVNLVQRIVESLLFFQPAVWLVSHWLRRDREECCDALVVAATGRPQQYAELLYAVASNQSPWQLNAAFGRHPVTTRIRRILNLPEESMLVPRRVLLGLVTACAAMLLVLATYLPRVQAEEAKNVNTESTEGTEESTEPKPKFAKEEYRYEGKTFEEWNQAWRTELSPERRLEAVQAIVAFEKVGYEIDSLKALLELGEEYADNHYPDTPGGKINMLTRSAVGSSKAIRELPAEVWLPVLEQSIQEGNSGLIWRCTSAIPSPILDRLARDESSLLHQDAQKQFITREAQRCIDQIEPWPSATALEILNLSAASEPRDWLPILEAGRGYMKSGVMRNGLPIDGRLLLLFPELSGLFASQDESVRSAVQVYASLLETSDQQELAKNLSSKLDLETKKPQLLAVIRTIGGLEILARASAAKRLEELQRHADEEIAIAALVAWCQVNGVSMGTYDARGQRVIPDENRWWTEFVQQRFPNAPKITNSLRDVANNRTIVSADKPPRELTAEESRFIDQYLLLNQRVLKERGSYPRQR